ncbi:hypothetical protein [Acidiferrobacter sp.]|uniref:hypothetical protein n=1 Tax=Acidiferrobacter sp. TaxID=1872107 RepID=UPI00261557CF|nr:hypothetical protein [Acidiferrobacter sp.]
MWALLHSSFVQSQLIHVVLVPAAVAGLVAMSSRFLAAGTPRLARGLAGLAVPAAFLAGYFEAYRDFTFPPTTVLSWVPWFVLLLAMAASLRGWTDGAILRPALSILAAACGAAVLLWPILGRETFDMALPVWAVVAAVWSTLWVVSGLRGVGRPSFLAVSFITSGGLAVVAPLSGSILLGELAATLAVALGASLILAGPVACSLVSDAGRATTAFILGALLLDLRFYAGAGEATIGAFMASVAVGLIAAVAIGRSRREGSWAVLGSAVCALIPVVIAVDFAFRASRMGGGAY